MNNPCVRARVTIRRVQRHPISQKTLRSTSMIQKHMVRGATFNLVPDAINDFAFHHAHLSIDEAIHIIADQVSISSMSAILAITFLTIKSSVD